MTGCIESPQLFCCAGCVSFADVPRLLPASGATEIFPACAAITPWFLTGAALIQVHACIQCWQSLTRHFHLSAIFCFYHLMFMRTASILKSILSNQVRGGPGRFWDGQPAAAGAWADA